jgi:hypothetical protein
MKKRKTEMKFFADFSRWRQPPPQCLTGFGRQGRVPTMKTQLARLTPISGGGEEK